MASIVGKKIKEKIDKAQIQQYGEVTGVILDYDKLSNTATIRYPNPHGGGYLYREHASVTTSLGGITSDAIRPGQKCSISFINNNIRAPRVTGITDSLYLDKTNTDQGAYLVDRATLTVEKRNGLPMIDNWFDDSNENTGKYSTDYNDYTDTDVSGEVYNIINGIDKYKQDESGVTNLRHKTNVKHTENGDIEIFVSNNVGVRISTTDHKIYFYGKGIYLNDKELTCDGNHYVDIEQVESDSSTDTDDESILNDFERNVELINIDVEELKMCIAYLKKITGAISKYKTLETKIEKYEKIRDSYERGVTPILDVISMNNEILALHAVFSKELKDAKKVVDANSSLTN